MTHIQPQSCTLNLDPSCLTKDKTCSVGISHSKGICQVILQDIFSICNIDSNDRSNDNHLITKGILINLIKNAIIDSRESLSVLAIYGYRDVRFCPIRGGAGA